MKTKIQLLSALVIAAAAFFPFAAPAQDQKKPAAQKPQQPKKPTREEITRQIRKQNPPPKLPIKTGGNVSFQLLSGATVRGKLIKVQPTGLRISAGKFTFLQRKNTITLKDRARF